MPPLLPERSRPPVQLIVSLFVIVRKLKSWSLLEEIVSVVPEGMEAVEAVAAFQLPPDHEGEPVRVSDEMERAPEVSLSAAMVALPLPENVPPLRVRLGRLTVPEVTDSVPLLR